MQIIIKKSLEKRNIDFWIWDCYAMSVKFPEHLFESLDGGQGMTLRIEISGKIKKSFTYFEGVFFLESDQLMFMINMFLILWIL